MRAEIESAVGGADRLGREQALWLFGCDDIIWLGSLADEVRRRLNPDPVVTYVVDRNINYTNICVSGCRFCAFYRREGDPEGYVLTRGQIGAKIDEARALGAVSVLLQGGMHPGLGIEYFEDLFRFIKAEHPIHLHALSPPEVVHIAQVSGLDTATALSRLRDAGLGSLPGGGAEILSDRIRREVSPRKCSAGQWLRVMGEAHALGLRSSATMMFAVGESAEDRVEHLLRIREQQEESGGFTAFIAWTFQPANTAMAGQLDRGAAEGAFDYLRTLAAARLVLDNVQHIQASWVTQGAKVAQLALGFGADDFGSTMIEENVVAAAGIGFRMSEGQIRRAVTDAGYKPERRDPLYSRLEQGG